MASSAQTQALLDKLGELSREKLAEVEDFVDFLREKQRRNAGVPPGRMRAAVDAGRIAPPATDHGLSSASDEPPVAVPGTPLSKTVLRDRR